MSTNLKLRVLIVEDEIPASEKLERYLMKYSEGISIIAKLTSIEDSVNWLQSRQNELDLIFMDIQLTDGLSFNIFQQVKIDKPIIFITAYNEYALDAFKMNGIDYLLKPIIYTDLENSLNKLENLKNQLNWNSTQLGSLKETIGTSIKSFKTRFMVKLGDHIKSITTDQICFFFADGRDVYLVTNQLRKFIIDFTLESLDEIVSPSDFFRINRSYIVNIHAIQDVVVYSNSRLKILSTVKWDPEMIVSREKVNDFKNWFDGQN